PRRPAGRRCRAQRQREQGHVRDGARAQRVQDVQPRGVRTTRCHPGAHDLRVRAHLLVRVRHAMATETSYYDRTIEAVRKQAEARGIVELDGLKAALEQKYGKLVELPDPQLRKLNQELPAFLEAYLGGVK